MALAVSLKVFFTVWMLSLMTFFAFYLYTQMTTLSVDQLIQEFNQNILKVDEQKISLSTLKTLINSKMNDKSSRLQYLQEYFADAEMEKEELEKIDQVLEGVQLDSLEEYEVKVREFVESKVENEEKKEKFLKTLDIIKVNIADLDDALQILVDNYNKPQNIEL
ncbi:unnamed protein product [Bursaphelenchus xylophilus]|uniref:(pine wood nematode) hypothetical protein n=1 Tax=Bursaphelenchus xylophilus TaxID=6326 RepID=A0A7I8WTJ4_BURXY|nr:unnamed protein product [Bursaphelenchus xylophilus]CAG9116026.1 unnamed protein product [Bursaphelenchus xylophilus]